MLKLIKKELSLCLHPTTFIYLLFAAFVFIPNYPYEVMFFFSTLGTFMTCLSARENKDLFFTCTLPVSKSDVAKAKVLTTAIFQIILIGLTGVLVIIKKMFLPAENVVGMDANAAFIGMGLIILGVFNITFFTMHFSNPDKVGVPFLLSAIITFVLITVGIVLCHVSPYIRDCIDTIDSEHLLIRLIVLIVGAVIYVILTALTCLISAHRLQKVDL
ncbi:MAG: ABC-2 transporter permease [Clostridiales bacterium]|nr:ABC-2 transporter permease [Clostridiales bacterium]